jgi:hypothetical protein
MMSVEDVEDLNIKLVSDRAKVREVSTSRLMCRHRASGIGGAFFGLCFFWKNSQVVFNIPFL